jgi:hypothetical protein
VSYKNSYEHFLVPFSVEDLPSDIDILPPVYKKQRGRPKTIQIRKGAYKRKETRCSNCGKARHNVRRCPNAPAVNSRQQRAWIESSSSDTSSHDSTSNDSDNESIDTDDLEWIAEMERYDEIQARAKEIIERLRQEELEDNNIIDSSEIGGDDTQDAMDGIEIEATSQGGYKVEEIDNIQTSGEVQGPVFSLRKTRSGRKYNGEG